jgi:hypothetical protein
MFLKGSLLGLVTAAYLSVHHVMGKSAVRWDKLIHNPEAGFFVDMDGSKVLHIRVNQHFIGLCTVTKEKFLDHAMGHSFAKIVNVADENVQGDSPPLCGAELGVFIVAVFNDVRRQ